MTESLKTKLKAAKTPEEMAEICKNNVNEFSKEDLENIKNAVANSGELTEEQLDSVVGGEGWSQWQFDTWIQLFQYIRGLFDGKVH